MKCQIKRKTRKLINRSGKSKCEICNGKAPLQEHHIEGKNILNPNHSSNLCSICGVCHDKIHLGIITLERWAKTTNGTELLWHYKNEESFTGNDAKPYLIGS